MGYYIEVPKNKGKVDELVNLYDAEIVPQPVSFESIPNGKALVVVVDNGAFEAAGYVYDPKEFQEFTDIDDDRPKSFVLMDEALVQKLTRFRRR